LPVDGQRETYVHCTVNIATFSKIRYKWHIYCAVKNPVIANPMQVEQDLIESVLETLRGLPQARAELGPRAQPSGRDRGYDARIDLHIGGESVSLLIEAKRAVYPRDVREVIWQIRRYMDLAPSERANEQRLPLIVAESISPGAKELLRKEQVGYFDSGGSLFVPARGAYVYIEKPPPKPLAKALRSLFSGRRTQVLQVLLTLPHRWVSVKELAEQSQASPATVSQVMTELERFDWLETRGQGPSKERLLREPGALLDAWSKQLGLGRPPALRRYYVPAVKSTDLPERLDRVFEQHQVAYAITHEAAAQRYAPFLSSVSQVRCRLMPGRAAEEALGAVDARVVTDGANLAVIEAKSAGELLFRERLDGVWLASAVQVYLDLVHGEGRAKEMAEHLRHERIGF
jgi:hypothetical protein